MANAAGKEVTTIEGLDKEWITSGPEGLDADQRAAMWLLPGGQIMQAAALFEQQEEAYRSPKSMRLWPETSAAAELISAFARR